jgi:hypothetical protein
MAKVAAESLLSIGKHSPIAIEACRLFTMLAYNLFEAFIRLNLKAVVRELHTKKYFACLIAAELYGNIILPFLVYFVSDPVTIENC